MSVLIKNNYKFACRGCGECCHLFGLRLKRADVLNWDHKGRDDLLDSLQIHPFSLTTGIFENAEVEGRIEELQEFIFNNHDYQGEPKKFKYVSFHFPHQYLSGYGIRPIFTPKTFQTILMGMNWGIDYTIFSKNDERCIFLKKKKCAIHDIKPITCQRFPFDVEGNLLTDLVTQSMCKGIKQLF